MSFTLVNAKDYGVAEERKRVFYIGFRKDLNIDFGFPKGSTKDDDKKITLRDIIWDLQDTAVPSGEKIIIIQKQSITMNTILEHIRQYL